MKTVYEKILAKLKKDIYDMFLKSKDITAVGNEVVASSNNDPNNEQLKELERLRADYHELMEKQLALDEMRKTFEMKAKALKHDLPWLELRVISKATFKNVGREQRKQMEHQINDHRLGRENAQ